MFALLYLIVAFWVGWVIMHLFKIDSLNLFARISGRTNKLPPAWTFDFPFSIIVGVTVLTTVHYYLSFLFSLILTNDINPMLATNLILIPLLILFFFLSYHYVLKKSHIPRVNEYFVKVDSFYWKTLWFFGLLSIFIIFYSFFVYRGILNSGVTVFGDFAPHTAIINSFAKGNNFPTQYPHFAGDGIQYHFFFFYLCANLVLLGLRIDFAMNIPSILGILSFVLLLGGLGVLLTKRKRVFFLAPFMLFFRSSYAIFSYLGELIGKKGSTPVSVIMDFLKTDKFIGTSPHDDWGLWTLNVYANQRHFLWGFSIMLIILFIFLPSIRLSIFKSKKYLISENSPIEYENGNILATEKGNKNKQESANDKSIAKISTDNKVYLQKVDNDENIAKSDIDRNIHLADSEMKSANSQVIANPEMKSASTQEIETLNPSTIAVKVNSVSLVQKVVRYFTNPELWKVQKPNELILSMLLIACLPYWHGSILISLLCILFVMAFFARDRISYICVAGAGVLSALLQARFFSGGAGNVANPTLLWGFISDDKSLVGVAGYLFQVLGIAFVFLIVLPFLQQKFQNRVFLIACLTPILFALLISLTPDVTVNHKYIIIAIALLNIFIADLFCDILRIVRKSHKELKKLIKTNNLRKSDNQGEQTDLSENKTFKGEQTDLSENNTLKEEQNALNRKSDKKPDIFNNSTDVPGHPFINPKSKVKSNGDIQVSRGFFILSLSKKFLIYILSSLLSLFIAFSLFATGVPEFIGYTNKNISTVKVDLNSPLTKWLERNTNPEDVFLTAPYHMNEFFFSGRKVFYGWAYFTWSAGHDTVSREIIVKDLFGGCNGDLNEFLAIVKLYGIRYAIIDSELLNDKTYMVDTDFFKDNFIEVANFPSIRSTKIYKLY